MIFDEFANFNDNILVCGELSYAIMEQKNLTGLW